MKILVRAPNWIGDQVLAYPFFFYLRQAYPQARITAVCVAWVQSIQYRSLVDDVFILPSAFRPGWREKLRVLEDAARELKKQGPWDLAFSLPNSFSAAWLLWRTGVKRRRGYRMEGRGFLLNESSAWDPSPLRHRGQAYVDLIPEELRPKRRVSEFWGVPAESDLDNPTPGELSEFNSGVEWPSSTPEPEKISPPTVPYWVLAPGATAESRRWSTESFAELARTIMRETGMKGVIVGGPSEATLADELCSDSSLGLLNRTAQCPVPGLAPLFKQAKFTVSNESGLAHVAALSGSFVQIVCGAADPRRTRPLGPGRVQVAVNPVDCWPCERNTCFQSGGLKLQCLKGIHPSSVWEEIQRGLKLAAK